MQSGNLNLHIAEVGELFQDEDSFDFLSSQNLLEYDFIIIDTKTLLADINGHSIDKIKKRFSDLKDFIAQKNLPIAFIQSVAGHFTDLIGDKTFTIYELLDLEVKETETQGRKIESPKDGLFNKLFKENPVSFEYVIGYSVHPGNSIGYAQSQKVPIGFYTRDYIFMPTFNDDEYMDDDVFLTEVYNIALAIRRNDGMITLPDWTTQFHLPEEKDKRKCLSDVEKTIIKLEKKKREIENTLSQVIAIKQLWTSSGTVLEKIVQSVFEELGFEILQIQAGRSDLTMKWNERIIVAEIKGISKSAGEKNAAQLEKWVSSYFSDNGVEAKGLLIANTYREMPLEERTEPSFPDQMLKYTKQRGHCLINTISLCNILLYCRQHPTEKDKIIDELLLTEGRYEKFTKWNEYLEKEGA
jgi:hypothetical protein